MQCPQCQQPANADAAFCGNCGAPLTVGSAEVAGQQGGVAIAVPAEAVNPAKIIDHSGKAIAACVIGLLGLLAWLVPIAGLVFGLLAMIFGTIAFHSRRRVFARTGIALSILVLGASLFMWVHSAQQLSKADPSTTQTTNTAADGSLQVVVTPCYSTRLPRNMSLVGNNGSCTFTGTDPATGEQQSVKVLNVPGLSQATLPDVARGDAANITKSIAGGKLSDERAAQFAGSTAYQVSIQDNNDSGGMVDYIYNPTTQGNLVIVTHSQVHLSGDNFDLSLIESNWKWL
jgi:uncharacterized membrane protein